MKMKVVFYGCFSHFCNGIIQKNWPSIEKPFICGFNHLMNDLGLDYTLDSLFYKVETEDVIIPRLYFTDFFLESLEGDTVSSEVLEAVSEEFGRLWTEYVRSFIDSGGVVVCRVSNKKFRAVWSPHGLRE